MGDLEVKGHVEINGGVLKLSKNGKELLRKRKERVVESSSTYVCIDGIFGDVVELGQNSSGIKLEDGDKNCIELKPKKYLRMRALREI